MNKLSTRPEAVARTSEQWWEEVKADPAKLESWLQKQYHGEVTAADRIRDFAEKFSQPDTRASRILNLIASQEMDHASWVGSLLVARGIEPRVLDKDERYWEQTLPQIGNFATGAAVAAHAERMRLERIRVIAHDLEAPDDIRTVFDRILPQEVFHERAFTSLAGPEAMQATVEAHLQGREVIGLFPSDE
jgi:rubrerythrin